jgi:hypothetical protein
MMPDHSNRPTCGKSGIPAKSGQKNKALNECDDNTEDDYARVNGEPKIARSNARHKAGRLHVLSRRLLVYLFECMAMDLSDQCACGSTICAGDSRMAIGALRIFR